MNQLLDDLYNIAIEQKPCPYHNDPEYMALAAKWESFHEPIQAALGDQFFDSFMNAYADISLYEMQQDFLAGVRLGMGLARLTSPSRPWG